MTRYSSGILRSAGSAACLFNCRFFFSPVRGPTEHSLSYRAPTLEPSVPVLGGVRPRVKNAGFGPTFFDRRFPREKPSKQKKLPRDKCPISPTKSKSIGTEGSCPRTFPRVGPRVGPGQAGFPDVPSTFLTYASGACSTAPLPHKQATLAQGPEL